MVPDLGGVVVDAAAGFLDDVFQGHRFELGALLQVVEVHHVGLVVLANDVIPADGEVIEGVASVDESAITGESAPVIRESGGDRSAVTGGTRVLSDWIRVQVTANPGETFIDRMKQPESQREKGSEDHRAGDVMLHMSETDVRRLVLAHTEGRQFDFLGEARVNVLELNLALDRK